MHTLEDKTHTCVHGLGFICVHNSMLTSLLSRGLHDRVVKVGDFKSLAPLCPINSNPTEWVELFRVRASLRYNVGSIRVPICACNIAQKGTRGIPLPIIVGDSPYDLSYWCNFKPQNKTNLIWTVNVTNQLRTCNAETCTKWAHGHASDMIK